MEHLAAAKVSDERVEVDDVDAQLEAARELRHVAGGADGPEREFGVAVEVDQCACNVEVIRPPGGLPVLKFPELSARISQLPKGAEASRPDGMSGGTSLVDPQEPLEQEFARLGSREE